MAGVGLSHVAAGSGPTAVVDAMDLVRLTTIYAKFLDNADVDVALDSKTATITLDFTKWLTI